MSKSEIVLGTVTDIIVNPEDKFMQGTVLVKSLKGTTMAFRVDLLADKGFVINSSRIVNGDYVLIRVSEEDKLSYMQILLRQ